jgi:hypothetical protein
MSTSESTSGILHPLNVEADIDLLIDGQPAKVTGSGDTLRLELDKPYMLRKFFQIELPNVAIFSNQTSGKPSFSLIPIYLAEVGLTLEIADKKGPLILLGKAAAGKSYRIPGVGKLENVSLASTSAVFRLAFNG